jgi:hemerythrin-like domain-containing protein
MSNEWNAERRKFLHRSGIAATALLTAGGAFAQARKVEKKQEEVGPTEDLMREHGVLNRVLLIYDHFIAEIDHQQDLKPEWVTGAATVIRRFVEDYHERQEEQFLFPRFEKAGVLTDLVPVLKAQHDAGRQLTDQVMSLAKARAAADRTKLAASLRKFIRMYRPHEAREDTVLFPAVRKIVSPHEFDALGEQFENNEHKQFGGDGFEIWRDRVAELEKQLGIYDLAQFTPKV